MSNHRDDCENRFRISRDGHDLARDQRCLTRGRNTQRGQGRLCRQQHPALETAENQSALGVGRARNRRGGSVLISIYNMQHPVLVLSRRHECVNHTPSRFTGWDLVPRTRVVPVSSKNARCRAQIDPQATAVAIVDQVFSIGMSCKYGIVTCYY